MKKHLLNLFLFIGLLLTSVVTWAQAPVLNYTGSPYTITAGTAISPINPNTTNPVGAYGTINATWAAGNAGGATGSMAAITFDATTGSLYGTEYSYGAFDKITTAGTATRLNGALPGTTGICVVTDSFGNLYITNNSSGNILVYNPSSPATATITITGFNTPRGLAIDASNNLYVVDANGTGDGVGKIFKLPYGATSTAAATQTITGLNNPYGVAVSGVDLYVTEFGSTTALRGIYKLPGGVNGTNTPSFFYANTALAAPFKNPRNLTFDTNGNLFVADFGNNTIEKITPAGVLSYPFGATNASINTPDQITFDAAGNLYFGDLATTYFKKSLVTYYTITSGTLPTGLTMNPVTGVISGTPTAAGANPVTITAVNSSGTSAAASLTFNFSAVAPTVSYTATTPVPPYTFTVGTAVPATVVPTSTNVKATGGFAIAPAATFTATGLVFNANTGAITGTPTAVSATQLYTVTVTGPTGLTGITTFNLTVVNPPAPTTISYSPAPPMVFTQGTAITNETPTVTGSYPATGAFQITNNATAVTGTAGLPSGLAFNANTGVISGTATVVQAITSYTVTVTNPGGLASVTFNLTVNPKAPSIAYTPATYTFGVGTAGATSAATNSGGTATYSVDPTTPFPTYLSLNTVTGVITSSTASVAAAAATYKIIATNVTSTSTANVTITELAKPVLAYSTPNNYTVGTAIPALSPANTGGAVAAGVVYSTTGTAVLSGLSGATGIATDPAGNVYVTNFSNNTVTEYSTSGTVTTFGSAANLNGPVGIVFDSSGNAYVLNRTGNSVAKFTNGVFQGTIITGLLTPTGITIDAANNIYVGNSATNGAGNYTISKYTTAGGTPTLTFNTNGTGYPVSGGIAVDGAGVIYVVDNSGGSYVDRYSSAGAYIGLSGVGSTNAAIYVDASNNIYLTATGSKNVLVYSPGFASLLQTITPPFTTPAGVVTDKAGNLYVADFGANTVTKFPPVSGYYLSGQLPAGLSFNNTNGNITGTPTVGFSGTFTVTAYNVAGGGTSNVFTINCSVPVPNLTYTATNVYQSGIAFTLTPTNSGGATTAAGISPALPTGVSISATGVITGTTATTASPQTAYTVTPSNTGGTGTANAFTIQIADGPAFSYTTPNVYTIGTPVTLTPTITAGSPTGFAVTTGTLPAGLTLSPTTGVISGTPTTAKAAANYVITATNTYGFTGPATVNIKVVASQAFAYTGPNTYTVGTPITALSPTGAGTPLTAASSSPGLPAGLVISTAGVISGTPTTPTAMATYTITGTTANGGTSTATVTITVTNTTPPNLTYTATNVYQSGVAFTLAPTNSGGGATTALISPSLPAGVSISNAGIITGTTATVASAQTPYTVTPSNSGGTGTANSFTIQIADGPAFTYNTPNIGTVGTPFSISPTITAGGPFTGYTTTGTLPTGLTLDPSTGVISGTPSATKGATIYTINATNAYGFTGTFGVNIKIAAPPAFTYTNPAPYIINQAITALSPTVTANGPLSNAVISPALPTGLTISASGVISGTPTVLSPATLYTVTATGNGGGTGTGGVSTATVTISVVALLPPSITYPSPAPAYTFMQYSAIITSTPTNTGGTIPAGGYAISTPLPTGLSFDVNTGAISGTPTVASATTSYTVTATNASGNSTATFTILVNPLPPPNISYVSPSPYYAGTTISPLSPTNTGGAVGTTGSYGPAVTLTGGTVNTPRNIGIDPTTGDVYVCNSSGSINIYDPNGVFIRNFAVTGRSPVGIVFDSSGNAYVLDATSDRVYKFTGNSPGNLNGSVAAITPAGAITNAYGIAIDASGALYIADYSANTYGEVYKYQGSGTAYSLTATFLNNPIYNVTDVAVDPSGNVFATSVTNPDKYVVKYGPNGAIIDAQFIAGTYTSIYIDGGGNIYLTSAANNTVSIYNNAGTLLSTITVTGAEGVAVDSKGDIFVSTTGNKVFEYKPVSGYTIDKTLPAGLSFDSNTGTFSGTPTLPFPATVFTVTATNQTGTSSAMVSLSCISFPPNIVYDPNSYTFAAGVTIPTVSPTNNGGAVPSTPSYGAGTVILNAGNGISNPIGVAVDPAGNVYTVNNAAGTVTEYTVSGTPVTYATGLTSPVGIAFDSMGNAYVLTTNGLYKYTNGILQGVTFTGITNGSGITIDAANNIYVATTTGKGVIQKFSSSGGAGTTLLTIPNTSAYQITGGIAVDNSGNLYFVDNGGTPTVDFFPPGGTISVFEFISAGYGVAIDQGDNVFFTGNNQLAVFNQAGDLSTNIYGLTDPRGSVTDAAGNLYVSDYTNNTVTRYKPTSGYLITGGTLPAGLTFDNATGNFDGAPTTTFPATTITVTATNSAGSSTTTVTFTCGNANYWHGITAADQNWNTPSNWSAGTVPLATDVAYIGTSHAAAASFLYLPVIPAGATATVGSIVMGSSNRSNLAAGIIANGTGLLTVNGSITLQADGYSDANYTTTLSGTGTIKATGIVINSNYPILINYTQQLNTSITNLNVSGPLSLVNGNDTYGDFYNSTFNVTGGTTSFTGTIKTNNIASANSKSKVGVTNGTLQLANATALSGLASNGVNTFTLNGTGATVEYSGAAQTVYTDKTVTGLIGGTSYQNIKFSGTGAKTPNAGNLNIAGDFTNTLTNDASNYLTLTAIPVFFNGTTEALAGGAGTGTIFKNVTFSGAGTKTMASGKFNVISTGLLTMSGSNNSTILNAGGFLTLQSDVNGTATVTAFTGPSITGNVNVQRFITGGAGYRGYRLLSSPVYTSNANGNNIASMNYPINNVYLKGSAGIAGGFDDGGNPNLYLFRENLPPSNSSFTSGNFRGVSNISGGANYLIDGDAGSFNLPVGNGFMLFFRGDRSQATLAAQSSTGYTPTNTTLTATGTLNQGAVKVSDWFTPTSQYLSFTGISGDATVNGFNLVGNPYPSSIDWDKYGTSAGSAIAAPGVGPFLYILDSKSSNYNVYQAGSASKAGTIATTASNIIPSGQGFFVVAGSTTASLTFNEAAKTNSQATAAIGNLFMGAPPVASVGQYMRLILAKDSVHIDGIMINFSNAAKSKYVFGEDAPYKLGNGPVSLASTSDDNIGLAINTLPLPAGSQVIKLQVGAATDGTYTLAMKEVKSIPAIYDVWLKDAYRKDSLDIKHNPTYIFDVIKSDTNSFGKNRFSLIIRQNSLLALHLLDFAGAKITAGTQIIWKTENEQNYTNFTVERSTDNGTTFQVIGGFASTGAGSYSFIDKAPVTTINDQYRLKLVDLNGNITYSNIVIIQYAPNSNNIARNGMTIYPNPAISTINISINQTIPNPSYEIQIVNNLGTVIKTATSKTTAWQDDVSRLVPGTYIIKVINNVNKTEVGKGTFVKL